jgi:hypothetical protein
MDLEDVKKLKRGQTLHHKSFINADGTPERWRVNGKVKTWKTRPNEVKVPVKRGLWEYGYVTNKNMHCFEVAE